MTTIKELAQKVQELIDRQVLLNGCGSSYIHYTHTDGSMWNIRVADHKANPQRVDNRTISFVVELPEVEVDDCDRSSMCVNKKTFRNITNQFFITDGVETESGDSIEYLLEYVIE